VPDRRLGEAEVPLACLQEIGRQQGVETGRRCAGFGVVAVRRADLDE
jgi:hypothetical protein